jgi:PilZ domain
MEPIDRGELFGRLHREFARYEFHVDAEVAWDSKTVWGRVTNISRRGMFIEIVDPPGVGVRFTVRLALNVPLQFECVVRRVAVNRGIGATLSVGNEAKERFEALLLAIAEGADPASTSVNLPEHEPPRTRIAAAHGHHK